MIVFITGLPGSGKSTVGKMTAEMLGWDFYEINEALSEEMKEKITEGILLSDDDLDEWLLVRASKIFKKYEDKDLVVSGMSGFKRHKEQLLALFNFIQYINLVAPYDVLKKRVDVREHFAGVEILDQCWERKEDVYAYGIGVDAEQEIEKVVKDCVALVKILKEKTTFSL